MLRRKYPQVLLFALDLSRDGIDLRDAFDHATRHLDAIDHFLACRHELDEVAAHKEAPAREVGGRARELHVDEPLHGGLTGKRLADLEAQDRLLVGFRRAEAVDARHRRDDDDVAAGEQGLGRGMTQAIDLLVDHGLLLDVGIG